MQAMQRPASARPCESSDRDRDGERAVCACAAAECAECALARPAHDERFYTASVHFLRRRLQEKSGATRGGGGGSWSCCDLGGAGAGAGAGGARGGARRRSVVQFCLDTPRLNSAALPMYQVLPFPKSNRDSLLSRIWKKFRKFREHLDESGAAAAPAPAADEDSQISNFKFPRCSRPAPGAGAGAERRPRRPRAPRPRRPRRALGGISEEESSADAYSDDSSAKTTGTESH